MRFKLGLILKLCILLTVALLSLVLLRESGTSTTVGEYSTLSQKRQLKNDSKSFLTNSKITQTEKSSETLDLAEASDSLAGKRIDGLPNITETRKEKNPSSTLTDFDEESVEILDKISFANKQKKINNEDLFGPLTNQTVVIMVQVHNRIKYLRHLIKSFSEASGIDKTLLIFSHDIWDEEINYLVRSIDFCKTTQIFYPLSLQTHKTIFPGKSKNDCPRDIKKPKALERSCTNAHWPDIHGHYREAQFTQTKHHWWWKANQVFGVLPVTKQFTGLVLFLEEDHYVAEDFLHVLSLMLAQKRKYNVDILSLGTYLKKAAVKTNNRQEAKTLTKGRQPYPPNLAFRSILWHPQPSFISSIIGSFKQAEVTEWISSKHNMGMAITREEWKKILNCSRKFCEFDDYNWDWSLQHISHHCLKQKLQVAMSKGPRVFHIGECGVHHKKTNCDSNAGLDKVKSIIQSSKTYMFPESLQFVKTTLRKKLKEKKPNGGWGDKRDHNLCLNFTMKV